MIEPRQQGSLNVEPDLARGIDTDCDRPKNKAEAIASALDKEFYSSLRSTFVQRRVGITFHSQPEL
jgi:hypothetical protein